MNYKVKIVWSEDSTLQFTVLCSVLLFAGSISQMFAGFPLSLFICAAFGGMFKGVNTMSGATIAKIRRGKYLTEEQIAAAVKHSRAFMKQFRDKTTENINAYCEAKAEFLALTEGREFCQMVPLTVW